jgi:hypothetical protein
MTSTRKGNNKTQSLKDFLQFFTLCVRDEDGLSTTDACLITSIPTGRPPYPHRTPSLSPQNALLIPTERPPYPHRTPSLSPQSDLLIPTERPPRFGRYGRTVGLAEVNSLRLWYAVASSFRKPTAVAMVALFISRRLNISVNPTVTA